MEVVLSRGACGVGVLWGALRGWRAGVPGAARAGSASIGGVARLIFEGWVPHDPVFVAVRGLGAGAATDRWLVVAHRALADCSSRRV